ncbi:MAG: dienelactone hydrolase family protein [Prevotellaceae bacterium]|nr:dienelactone hydrolase family protein [Candidatus Minthosoma caballi]
MRTKSIITLFIILFAISNSTSAQDCKPHHGTVKDSYNFWFYTPENIESKEAHRPLLVFLHGASLCGNNLERVKKYGPIDALKRGRAIDCYVLVPQNPGGSWNPRKIMNLIEWAEKKYNVDSNRIYVYGMSLGGYGTIDMCAAYPDRIAAGMAMCGGATAKDLTGLNKLPMWIIHGTADRAVAISESDKVVAQMKKNGDTSRLIYTRLPGASHGAPARIFYMYQTYDWMFSHSLKDKGRPINKDFEITNELLKTAYSDLGKNSTMDAFE